MSIRHATSAKPMHPALAEHHRKRRASLQNRIADTITRFAGSMVFVYVHIAWFSLWIGLGVEKFPYGLLTMMVSLEAIFLSTFLLISQNRQDEARTHLANMEWHLVQKQATENQLEIEQNQQLLQLSNQILELTKAIHELSGSHGPGPQQKPRP